MDTLFYAIAKATDNVKRLRALNLCFPSGESVRVDGLTFQSANKQPRIPRDGKTVRQWFTEIGIDLDYPHLQCIIMYDKKNIPEFIPLEFCTVKLK